MEGLDKLLDRLGFYDLIGVLLPGMIAAYFTSFADKLVFKWGISGFLSTKNMIYFLCVSYFIGVVLQETGSIIMKLLTRGKKILICAMKPNNKDRDSITEYEDRKLQKAMISAFPSAEDYRERLSLAYDFCKHKGGNSSAAEKDHSIAAMSRSMSIYFGVLGTFLLIKVASNVNEYSCKHFLAIAFSFVLMFLMGYRSFRFYKIRYIRIFRKYYYDHICGNKDDKNTQITFEIMKK